VHAECVPEPSVAGVVEAYEHEDAQSGREDRRVRVERNTHGQRDHHRQDDSQPQNPPAADAESHVER
jgi:hypothetical protein